MGFGEEHSSHRMPDVKVANFLPSMRACSLLLYPGPAPIYILFSDLYLN